MAAVAAAGTHGSNSVAVGNQLDLQGSRCAKATSAANSCNVSTSCAVASWNAVVSSAVFGLAPDGAAELLVTSLSSLPASFVRGGGRGQGRRRRAERPLRLSDGSDHLSAHSTGAGWRVDFSDDLAEVLVGHEVVQGSFVAEGVLFVGNAVLQAEALDDFDSVEP